MPRKYISTKLFYKYYMEWIHIYKVGAVRQATLEKYYLTQRKLKAIAPNLHMNELDRKSYQLILNKYAETHEKQTTLDFHHHLKAAIVDAVDDGFIRTDPTRRAIIKGKAASKKKKKYLNLFELQLLLNDLDLNTELNWDWFILLVAKTGLRFSEALALTPKDFDFVNQQIIINKSWNYKYSIGEFQPTKNFTSKRKVTVDWKLMNQFQNLIRNLDPDWPIFVERGKKIFNSTINKILLRHCDAVNIPIISIHGLRHTHASLLLFEGVSVISVSKRLGHANVSTTQETYLHIIQELENKDNDKILRHLSMI